MKLRPDDIEEAAARLFCNSQQGSFPPERLTRWHWTQLSPKKQEGYRQIVVGLADALGDLPYCPTTLGAFMHWMGDEEIGH